MAARENAAAKARRYLCEGRVVLQRVDRMAVGARVRGDGTVYMCSWFEGVWACDCPARTPDCAHLLAVRLVTAVDFEEVL